MLFVIDENSFGRLTCVLRCLTPQYKHQVTDLDEHGFSGMDDPTLLTHLAKLKQEVVLVSRDERMLVAHREVLLQTEISLLIINTDHGKSKKRPLLNWDQICGLVAGGWKGIYTQFEQPAMQRFYKIETRGIKFQRLKLLQLSI